MKSKSIKDMENENMESKRQQLKNIIFDMGNVLLDFNPEVSLNAFCKSEEEKDIVRKELFHGPEWMMADEGLILDRERYDLVKVRVPEKYWEGLKRCAEEWDICMKPVQGARQFCQLAKEMGYGVYILSNASDLFYRYFPNFLPMDFFDGIVVSADIKMVKPDEKIYRYILDKYQLNPQECLFIDDRAENVEGARKVGISAEVFCENYEQIRQKWIREETL